MPKNHQWTNRSVLTFAGDADHVETMEWRARLLALPAMDNKWGCPPFDPLVLAQRLGLNLGLKIEPRGDIADALLVPAGGPMILEYNPTRPRGSLRFSLAYEIAQTLFAPGAWRPPVVAALDFER